MTRGALAALLLGVLLVAGAVAAALVGPLAAAAPKGAAPAVPQSGAGSPTVVLSADSTTHPAANAVLTQLQRYYDAINARDHAAWQATVAADRVDQQPEQAWLDAYRSTKDGTIRIDRIDDRLDGSLLVRLRFVSTQALADAPTDTRAERICWHVTLPMTAPAAGSPPRISSTRGGSSVRAAC